MRSRSRYETVEVELDLELNGLRRADDLPEGAEIERLIGLAEEAARSLRSTHLVLALRDSIARCRRQMKIEA